MAASRPGKGRGSEVDGSGVEGGDALAVTFAHRTSNL